jgi:hypothetical protein
VEAVKARMQVLTMARLSHRCGSSGSEILSSRRWRVASLCLTWDGSSSCLDLGRELELSRSGTGARAFPMSDVIGEADCDWIVLAS